MKKGIRALISVVLVIGLVGTGLVFMYFGRIVKAAVETAGPRILGAPVTLGLVTLSPLSGRGTLRGLVIGNPPGFKSPHAVKVGAVSVKVKLASLATDLIVVESVAVRDPEVVLETGSGGTNLQRLQKNAEEAAAKLGGSSSGASKGPSKSMLIEDFTVSGGMLGASVAGREMSLPLPPVHLTNLGGKGRSAAQVASEALRAVTGSATKAVSGAASQIVGAAQSAVKDAAGALGGLFKKR